MRVPWASQSHHIPMVQWWIWLRRMITSMGACSFIPAISAPPSSLHVVDMVDMVVLDDAEHASHAADNATLLAVVDIAAADDMTSIFLSASRGTDPGRSRRVPSGWGF